MLTLLGAPGAAHEAAIREDVDLTVDAVPLLHEVAAAATRAGRPARVHLKIDTGMARGGATPASWLALVAAARSAEAAGNITITGIWSPSGLRGHTWTSVRPRPAGPVHRRGHAGAKAQGARPEVRDLADTAGDPRFPGTGSTWSARAARSTGWPPFPRRNSSARTGSAQPMTVRTRPTLVKRVPGGTPVSYGHRYTTQGETPWG